jgi:hypothetical protein
LATPAPPLRMRLMVAGDSLSVGMPTIAIAVMGRPPMA